ncbi:hypothetical protein RHECNPAF_730064 [Rhizobium etli CNPAF512]|nr:hypothetical protein RHECNPAF_730064 [Rhizobium etli CNPAF512]
MAFPFSFCDGRLPASRSGFKSQAREVATASAGQPST